MGPCHLPARGGVGGQLGHGLARQSALPTCTRQTLSNLNLIYNIGVTPHPYPLPHPESAERMRRDATHLSVRQRRGWTQRGPIWVVAGVTGNPTSDGEHPRSSPTARPLWTEEGRRETLAEDLAPNGVLAPARRRGGGRARDAEAAVARILPTHRAQCATQCH